MRTVAGLVASLALAVVAGYFAVRATQLNERTEAARKSEQQAKLTALTNEAEARKEAKRATIRYSHYLATLANNELKNHDPGTALALGLEAFVGDGPTLDAMTEDIRAERAIQQALLDLKEVGVLDASKIGGRILTAAFAPDGKTIVTLHSTGSAGIWNLERSAIDGEPLALRRERPAEQATRLPRLGAATARAVFSANGSILLTVCDKGSVRLWSWPQRNLIAELPERMRSAAFDGTGSRIVAISYDQRAAGAWTAQGKPLLVLRV